MQSVHELPSPPRVFSGVDAGRAEADFAGWRWAASNVLTERRQKGVAHLGRVSVWTRIERPVRDVDIALLLPHIADMLEASGLVKSRRRIHAIGGEYITDRRGIQVVVTDYDDTLMHQPFMTLRGPGMLRSRERSAPFGARG